MGKFRGTARPRGTLISVPKIFSVSQNSVSQDIWLFDTSYATLEHNCLYLISILKFLINTSPFIKDPALVPI